MPAPLISSSSNPTIKRIRALSNRKARAESGQFFVEGLRIVIEALESGADVESLIVAPDLLTSNLARAEVSKARQRSIPITEVTAEVFASLSAKDGPQGLGAVVRQRWQSLVDIDPSAGLCWVALDAVQDPGNIGTVLRTCDAVGAAGLILLGGTVDPYDPGAIRASMGAVFALKLVRANFDELVTWARRNGCSLVGTSDKAQRDFQAVSYQKPLVLVMGSEREGLSPVQQSACDLMVSIPMVGRSDSLNLAVATGVMLYEIFNQRRRNFPAPSV